MAGRKPLSIEDVVSIVRFTGLDANGKGGVAYTLLRPMLAENKNRGELWIHWPGGEKSVVDDDSASQPKWSPDGDRVAYIGRMGAGEKEEGSGIYIAYSSGARRLAWFKHGVSTISWLDESRIAAVAREPVEGEWDEDYVATSKLPLWRDGAGIVAGLRARIAIVDAWSGRVEHLASEEQVGSLEACRDRIYYTVPADTLNPTKTRLVELGLDGEKKIIVEGPSIGGLKCIGGRLYLLAHNHEIGIASHYRLHVLEGERLECLTCRVLDRNIWSIPGDLEGEPVIHYADRGRALLAVYSEGRLEPVSLADGVEYVYMASSSGETLAYVAASPTKPPELYISRNGRRERATWFNRWVEDRLLAEPVHFTVEAAGDTVDAWLLLPPEAEGRVPLILYIHGGPKGMYGYHFPAEQQYFVGKGYAILMVNPRGSDGYSEEFADIRGRYGEVDYEQLMAALDKALQEYPIDPDRLAVTGISYGGYMTNVVITKTDRFRAAIAENGIADWIADYWASDIGYWFDPDQIGGTPQDNLEAYVAKSPAFHADRVKTPLLTIHSMHDYRCFIDQALAMHVSLVARGKESKLVVFREGSHGHSVYAKPRHRRKRLEIIERFLEEKLGSKADKSPGEG